jgi:alkylhydroperoxidase family enzyme
MARIPYFEPSEPAGPAAEGLPTMNILRMLGHTGEMMGPFSRFGMYLLNETSLDPVLREIAIIRVGVLSKASYEVYQHEAIGRRVGMSEDLIAGVHEGPGARVFTELQRQVMAFTDDIVANIRAGDATFNPLRDALGYKALQELVMVIGMYMLVSRYLETFEVEIEDTPIAPLKVSGVK